MRKTGYNKKIRLKGLFFLTAFLSLYLIQLVCNVPHLVQRLQPIASTPAHHHGAAHGGHSHTHGTDATNASSHQDDGHAHGKEAHSASSTEDAGCCAGQEYAPFVKASTSIELPALERAPFPFMGSLSQATLGFLYKLPFQEVSHAPPDAPVPKIPDIRIFLHSLVI
ncbi:hypothetical protein CLV24_105162 [Pontibacter ummariensis]|uniref:Uncharacterized protein n=1 Tax=Pontibacter ummariensis TaxID=1610492 RepID=A0A239DRM2_9BACT|nr:hypothetical protein [Pontibacter ummariensis]PRY13792.1 hypothetical protein CLV24_105162 [Pontibacter ummariensis]SNS34977.1 hypothetical protein SAMN06296052_10590 [Pontibacter ummariensis]